MTASKKICLVVPCHNEAKRLDAQVYLSFLQENQRVVICFVNDGSSDKTTDVLEGIRNKFEHQVHILSFKNKLGKAEAVRSGINHCCQNFQFDYIGYYDADCSTPFSEFLRLKDSLQDNVVLAFGSRQMDKADRIVRKFWRHIVGRTIARCINTILKFYVYDTQCGTKLMPKEHAYSLFRQSFISSWLFDVELLLRIRNSYGIETIYSKIAEVPLKTWIHKKGGKISLFYGFWIWFDLLRIQIKYNK